MDGQINVCVYNMGRVALGGGLLLFFRFVLVPDWVD